MYIYGTGTQKVLYRLLDISVWILAAVIFQYSVQLKVPNLALLMS